MANTDSFIEEVNEELRRDRLFSLFRKWGWIPVLIIIVIVGGAAWREYSIAQERAQAEAFGDALIAALENPEAAERAAGLEAITPAEDNARILLALLVAAERAAGDDAATAAAASDLRALSAREGLAPRYADLALLKAHLIAPQDFEGAMAEMTRLARPGRPFRTLAMEQQAYLHVENGDTEAAIALLRLLEEDSESTTGLQQRAAQLIVALESGAALAEPAPEDDTAPEETGAEPAEEPAENGEDSPAEVATE